MMIKFSKMRPGLLVCSGFRASRHRATRRSTRPFVPNDVIASPVCALMAVRLPR